MLSADIVRRKTLAERLWGLFIGALCGPRLTLSLWAVWDYRGAAKARGGSRNALSGRAGGEGMTL